MKNNKLNTINVNSEVKELLTNKNKLELDFGTY